MRRKICAYFGNRYAEEYRRHLDEIVEHGFNTVLHTFSEDDLQFQPGAVCDLIRLTRDAGLEAWVDPWGVGNLFGLGASSRYLAQRDLSARRVNADGTTSDKACTRNPRFPRLVREWLSTVASAGAQWVLWDEPNFTPCRCSSCVSLDAPMVDFLDTMTEHAYRLGMKNSVCVHALPLDHMLYLPLPHAIAALRHVDDIGVSTVINYVGFDPQSYTPYLSGWLDLIRNASHAFGCSSSCWIQGYQIPDGHEYVIEDVASLAVNKGIETLGHWGFRGCVALTSAANERPDVVWQEAKHTFTAL